MIKIFQEAENVPSTSFFSKKFVHCRILIGILLNWFPFLKRTVSRRAARWREEIRRIEPVSSHPAK